jgi:hypothetical protein
VAGGGFEAVNGRRLGGFAPDSPLEGEGFEPSVPREGNYARERPRLVCGAAGRGRAARRWRDWQREGGGLAGTGLRDTTRFAEDNAAGDDPRDEGCPDVGRG